MKTISINNPKKTVFGAAYLRQAMKDNASSGYTRIYILAVQAVIDQISPHLEWLKTNGIQICTIASLKTEPAFANFEELLKAYEVPSRLRDIGIDSESIEEVDKSAMLLQRLLKTI